MNKKLIISLVMIGVLAFGAGLGTFAWFTSTATSADNVFQAGTLKLDINGEGEGSYSLDFGTIDNMAPGDVLDPVIIEITNDGSLNLGWFGRFVVSSTSDNAKLAEAIYIKDAKMEFLTPDGTWLTEDHFIADGVGAGDYASYYDGLKDATMGVITLKNFLAANTMGAGAGVQMGALKPDNSYKFTFELGMAPLADNNYQGDKVQAMTLKYVVDATQIDADALNSLGTTRPYYINPLSNHVTWMNTQIDAQ